MIFFRANDGSKNGSSKNINATALKIKNIKKREFQKGRKEASKYGKYRNAPYPDFSTKVAALLILIW